eukprot:Pgem_evm1s1882
MTNVLIIRSECSLSESYDSLDSVDSFNQVHQLFDDFIENQQKSQGFKTESRFLNRYNSNSIIPPLPPIQYFSTQELETLLQLQANNANLKGGNRILNMNTEFQRLLMAENLSRKSLCLSSPQILQHQNLNFRASLKKEWQIRKVKDFQTGFISTKCKLPNNDDGLFDLKSVYNFFSQFNNTPKLHMGVRIGKPRPYYISEYKGRRTIQGFDYFIDLTEFIWPFGFVHSNKRNASVEDVIQLFVEENNTSEKYLSMEKKVYFRKFGELKRLLTAHISKNLGQETKVYFSMHLSGSVNVEYFSSKYKKSSSKKKKRLSKEPALQSNFAICYSGKDIFQKIQPKLINERKKLIHTMHT